LPVQTDSLVATTDGQHILGAAASLNGPGPIALSDINVTIPSLSCLPAETNPNFPLINGDTLSELALTHVLNTTQLSGVNATAVNQVIASPASNLAFVTYTADATNTGATLPFYQPNESSPGTLGTTGYVTLTGSSAITAPLAGAFSPDDKLFFVSTAGDNMIHYISVPLVSTNPTTADTQQISPNLPACTPGTDQGCTYPGSDAIVPATVIVVKARSTT
jgi:hypothetical protein